MQRMYSEFHIVQVSFTEVDFVSTEVPELPVRVTRISSEVHLIYQEFQLISATSSEVHKIDLTLQS